MAMEQRIPLPLAARAEKFFARGNYFEAKKEWEGLLPELSSDAQQAIEDKILACEAELGKAKAQTLVSKARKLARADELAKALACFEEAAALRADDSIREEATRLRSELLRRRAPEEASAFEAAGDYASAVEVYGRLIASVESAGLPPDPRILYSCGFALAKTGDFYGCWTMWSRIQSEDVSFLEQRRVVQAYCVSACSEKLWSEGRYEEVRQLLSPFPVSARPEIVALMAKTLYQLSECSPNYLNEFASFWLTAVFHPGISAEVRSRLLSMAEALLLRHAQAGDPAALRALACWRIEKQLMLDLHALAADGNDPAVLCAPRFARRFNRCAPVLEFIRTRRGSFADEELFLRAGGYYSPGADSLFDVELERPKEALAAAPAPGDEFSDYCADRAHFAYGLHCLRTGCSRPERYLKRSLRLLDLSSRYERQLVDQASDARSTDELFRCEATLREAVARRPAQAMRSALSLVMSRRSVILANSGQMDPPAVERAMKMALELDPANELARGSLANNEFNRELDELGEALRRNKMGAAGRVAAASEHAEVREMFFDAMRQALDQAEAWGNRTDRAAMLQDISRWCEAVDPEHPILDEINAEL